ncbi:MAG TPA: methylenetetrahydrofolate reductase C-terminal domain-containing protein [Dehalococcoidales bacterium]|nr:methylenetetrahydrofolate reductase C-terminal domain-containing protein [Dehalococcoidales bacterium]
MITGEQKPLAEIKAKLNAYNKILLLGCGTCVKTCFAGGEDEVATLASSLRLAFKKDGQSIQIDELTIERQCEDEFIREAAALVNRNQAVLSLACGVGVQMVGSRFPKTPVLPGVNTTFMGILEKPGLFLERCLGCGDCFVDRFGGFCPISRCAKKLFNGPCGGSVAGQCEVRSDSECVWAQIILHAEEMGTLSRLAEYVPPKDWRRSYSGGSRRLVREDHVI